MADLRVGVIGLGVMGQNHVRVLSSLEGVRLVGVVDNAMKSKIIELNARLFQETEDLIKSGIDYCLVAVPTALHEEVATKLADAGIHALIEKPLAHNSESASKLVHIFNQAGLIGAVGHIERYNPSLQEARKRINNGDLGQLYQVLTRRLGPFPTRIADVGVVKDLATHDIDLTSWITGKPYSAVSARVAHRTGREYEDLVSIVAQLQDGTISSHNVSWLSPIKERRIVLAGEKGTFVADTLTADLTFYANGIVPTQWDDVSIFRGVSEGDVIRYGLAKPEPLRTEHENFRDAVLGKESEIATLEQGLNTVLVAEAVLESAASGRTVEILK